MYTLRPMALRVLSQFTVNSYPPDEHANSDVASPIILSKAEFGKWLPLPLLLLHGSQKAPRYAPCSDRFVHIDRIGVTVPEP